MRHIFFCTLFLLFALAANPSQADDDHRAVLSRPSAQPISELQFDSDSLTVEDCHPKVTVGHCEMFVILKGKYEVPSSHLIMDYRPVQVGEDGTFEAKIYVSSGSTRQQITAVDFLGKVRNEQITIRVPHWDLIKKTLYVSAGLGITTLTYEQNGISNYNALMLSGKIVTAYPLSRRWDLGTSTYLTLYPISKNQDTTLRFFGMSFRAGYSVPGIDEPWRFSVLGGIYYTTTFAQGVQFGFKNMSGPMIFPTIRRALSKNRSISGYLKAAAVSAAPFQFNFGRNQEYSAGLAYRTATAQGRGISFGLDVSTFNIADETATAKCRTASLGVTYDL